MAILAGIVVGGSIGAVIGWRGRCATGACPLTSHPVAGGLYGALIGAMVGAMLV